MDTEDRRALLTIPLIVLVGAAIALAGSQGGATVRGLPVFALCVALAYLLQWIAFIPAYLLQTERFYDLTGSITYLSVTVLAVVLSSNPGGRSLLLSGLVATWTIRLGTFLFLRVLRAGKDRRFDTLKTSAPRFLQTWTLQGLWVSLTLAAALAAITTAVRRPLGIVALLGALIWVAGMMIEVVADEQKRRFRSHPANEGRFIRTGLWAHSRHPNYFGEIVLWVGIAVMSAPVLRGWQWVTLISPIFVTILLTRISGVPLLEQGADERWGGQPDYEAYKARTPVLIPRLLPYRDKEMGRGIG